MSGLNDGVGPADTGADTGVAELSSMAMSRLGRALTGAGLGGALVSAAAGFLQTGTIGPVQVGEGATGAQAILAKALSWSVTDAVQPVLSAVPATLGLVPLGLIVRGMSGGKPLVEKLGGATVAAGVGLALLGWAIQAGLLPTVAKTDGDLLAAVAKIAGQSLWDVAKAAAALPQSLGFAPLSGDGLQMAAKALDHLPAALALAPAGAWLSRTFAVAPRPVATVSIPG